MSSAEIITVENTQIFGSNSVSNSRGIHIPWIGELRHPSRLCLQEWFFLLGATCMYSITLGFTLQRVVVVEKNSEDFTFALMLVIHIGFCSFYVIYGMFGHRPFEILAHLAGLLVLVLDCTLNLALTNDDFNDPHEQVIKVVRLSMVCFGTVLQFSTGVRILGTWFIVFKKPGCAEIHIPRLINWLLTKLCCYKHTYKFKGTPEMLRKPFNRRYLCCTLLTMDLQYEVVLIILVLEDGISDLGVGNSFLVFWVLLPYALLYFIVGHITFRFHNVILVMLFLACSWPLPIFIGKMIYDVVISWKAETDHMLAIITLFLAFIGLVMRVTVFFSVGWPCLRRCKNINNSSSPTSTPTEQNRLQNEHDVDENGTRNRSFYLEIPGTSHGGETTSESSSSLTSSEYM